MVGRSEMSGDGEGIDGWGIVRQAGGVLSDGGAIVVGQRWGDLKTWGDGWSIGSGRGIGGGRASFDRVWERRVWAVSATRALAVVLVVSVARYGCHRWERRVWAVAAARYGRQRWERKVNRVLRGGVSWERNFGMRIACKGGSV